jgi:hypothetical protein
MLHEAHLLFFERNEENNKSFRVIVMSVSKIANSRTLIIVFGVIILLASSVTPGASTCILRAQIETFGFLVTSGMGLIPTSIIPYPNSTK